jgi:hypothetical protein
LREAEKSLSAGDNINARLWLERTLQINPASARACGLFATLYEPRDLIESLRWNRQQVELLPTDPLPRQQRVRYLMALGLTEQAREDWGLLVSEKRARMDEFPTPSPDWITGKMQKTEALRENDPSDYATASRNLEQELAQPVRSAYLLADWLAKRLEAGETEAVTACLQRLPESLRADASLQLVSSVLKLAANPPSDNNAESKGTSQLISTCGVLPDFPIVTLHLASYLESHGWINAAETLVWNVADTSPFTADALAWLQLRAESRHNSRALWRLVKTRIEHRAGNLDITRRYIQLSCLLEVDLQKVPNHLDVLLKSKNAQDQLVAAYYLHLRGKFGEANKILNNLPESALLDDSLAVYTATMLKALGRDGDLSLVRPLLKPDNLLPEEKVLFQRLTGS